MLLLLLIPFRSRAEALSAGDPAGRADRGGGAVGVRVLLPLLRGKGDGAVRVQTRLRALGAEGGGLSLRGKVGRDIVREGRRVACCEARMQSTLKKKLTNLKKKTGMFNK